MIARHHAGEAYSGLKTATRLLISDLGGVDAASRCSRVQRTTWSDYSNPNVDKFIPIDVALDAEAIGGQPRVTEAMASILGFQLLAVVPRSKGALAASMAEAADRFGVLMSKTIMALADGEVTDAERADLLGDLSRLSRLLSEVTASLRRAAPIIPKP